MSGMRSGSRSCSSTGCCGHRSCRRGDPPVADADPISDLADGGPGPRDRPVGTDAGGRLDQVVLGGVEPEDGLGAGDVDRDDRGRNRSTGFGGDGEGQVAAQDPGPGAGITGHFDANHARLARSMLRRLDWVEQALAELEAVIAEAGRPWQHQIELLETIPGVGPKVAQVIIAETGADMTRFPSPAHLAAWAGLAPAMNQSAGRQTPAGKRHGNKWLNAMLVEAAGSVGRMHSKNYLAAKHARLTRRRGMGRAQVAVAHSILVAAYHMLLRDEPYNDLGADWHSRRNDEAHTRRLIAQLEHLGHTVIIDPAA